MEVKNTPNIPFLKSGITSAMESIHIKPEKQFSKDEFQLEKITKEMVQERVEGMNEFLEPTTTAVKFQFHEKLNEYYVQIVDSTTDEVLKEIPNKKFLDMYASMTELIGIVIDEKL